MSKFDSPLKNLKIASPCSANWEEMHGDNRKRFCGDCKLNVYNLSGMSKTEAESLLQNTEGRLCVRFYQRPDGTVLTQNCPVGWQAVKQRVSRFATAFASVIFGVLGGLGMNSVFTQKNSIGNFLTFVKPTPERTMGIVARPTNTPKPKPTATPKEEAPTMGAVAMGERVAPPTKKQSESNKSY